MWILECGRDVWEMHDKELAEVTLKQHKNIDSCTNDHVIFDDGVDCKDHNCAVPYIREDGEVVEGRAQIHSFEPVIIPPVEED